MAGNDFTPTARDGQTTDTPKVVDPPLTPEERAAWRELAEASTADPDLAKYLKEATSHIIWDTTASDYRAKLQSYIRRQKRAEIEAWGRWQKQRRIDRLANEVF